MWCEKCEDWTVMCDCEKNKAKNDLKDAIKVLEMVEDNSKMPHQHTDPQLRLYCLAERAREVLEKIKGVASDKKENEKVRR